MSGMSEIVEQLSRSLPPIITRTKVYELTGGLFTRGHMQNLDSEGRGPRRLRGFKKICYTKQDFLTWLEQKLVCEESRKNTATHLPPWQQGK